MQKQAYIKMKHNNRYHAKSKPTSDKNQDVKVMANNDLQSLFYKLKNMQYCIR